MSDMDLISRYDAAAYDYMGTNAQIGRIIVALDGANASQEK